MTKTVWADLCDTPEDALSMELRYQLMSAVVGYVKGCQSQAAAAKVLGVTAPRLSDLIHGRLHKFSLEALITLALRAGYSPRLVLKRAA